MALTTRGIIARIAYGVLFCVVVPAVLVLWAWRLQVNLPAYQVVPAGAAMAALGGLLIVAGGAALVRRGGGLPMNAFPPPRLVTTGIYALLPHPIYVGFVLVCAGVSLATGSASGLWVVTPLTALAASALVWGYERDDLRKRFGVQPRPWLSLPPAGDEKPPWPERFAVLVLVFLPWLVLYPAVGLLGQPPDAVDFRLPFEKSWPVWPWTEVIYISAYLVVPLAVLLAPSRSALRRFGWQGLLATGSIILTYLVVPAIAPLRPHQANGLFGALLDLEHAWSQPPVAAFPSFHVVWACLAAELLARRSRLWTLIAWAWALAVSASCITTGMHALVDIPAGLLAYLGLRYFDSCYGFLLRLAERLANAWRQWRIGPLRIINHGIFPAAAAFVGVLTVGWLTGSIAWTAAVALGGLVTAAIGAQTIEGSPTLLRPFGYYGFVVGGLLVVVVCALSGGPALLLLAAGAVAAPWIQALGRCRCLVQGCCHGRPVDARFGIRVHEPHSRVARIEHLAGLPIHPTQLYSILGNIVIGLLLARLWSLGAALPLIGGLYLILSGLARFVEESYRGEPQTPMWGRLAIYHWMAIGSVAFGVAVTCVPGDAAPRPADWPNGAVLAAALGAAVVFWLAMAVDLPDSRRRFARLSG